LVGIRRKGLLRLTGSKRKEIHRRRRGGTKEELTTTLSEGGWAVQVVKRRTKGGRLS